MRDQQLVAHVRAWLQNIVIDLQLCPFAERELKAQKVRFTVTRANHEDSLLLALQSELQLLEQDSSIETSLLIHPDVLQDFDDYNQFLNLADTVLHVLQLEGVYQIAGFHPDYQFADTRSDDVANYTNRSPYPMLHLLREASVERAIGTHPDIASVPVDNIARMRRLGTKRLLGRLALSATVVTE